HSLIFGSMASWRYETELYGSGGGNQIRSSALTNEGFVDKLLGDIFKFMQIRKGFHARLYIGCKVLSPHG
ncbi:unnamed protein product, partial [Ilex paraguariensis]